MTMDTPSSRSERTFAAWRALSARLLPPAQRRRAAVGAALMAVAMAGLVWENQRLQRTADTRDAVVVWAAAQDLKAGTVVTRASLAERRVPPAYLHERHVAYENLQLIDGQVLAQSVAAGDVLLWSDFAGPERQSTRLSALVPRGERAVAVRVDDIASVGHHVAPGDHVDLFVTLRRPSGRVVMPVLQNVVVVGTGNRLVGEQVGTKAYGRVVVSVTPREAQMLLLAQQTGEIYLLLRNESDVAADADFPVLNEHELIGGETRKSIQKQRNERVKIIKGSG